MGWKAVFVKKRVIFLDKILCLRRSHCVKVFSIALIVLRYHALIVLRCAHCITLFSITLPKIEKICYNFAWFITVFSLNFEVKGLNVRILA